MLKFIVLSDIHLVPPGQTTYSIDTHARLRDAISHVNRLHSDAAFVVFAGDIAERGETDVYALFFDALTHLSPPAYVTLGNHDDPAAFARDAAGKPPNLSQTRHAIDAEGYRVIVLDSVSVEQGSAGFVSLAQLDWLSERLDDARDRPVIVILHHNVAPLHVQTDTIMLSNAADLLARLKQHPDVRQIISGHVHMTTSGVIQGMPFSTLGGAHYAVDPVLETVSGRDFGKVPRREGPGQLAVVLADEQSVVVHFENVFDSHRQLTAEDMGGNDA